MIKKPLPNRVRLVKLHGRHVTIVDAAKASRIHEATQALGADHAAALAGVALESPEAQCRRWLAERGYVSEGPFSVYWRLAGNSTTLEVL